MSTMEQRLHRSPNRLVSFDNLRYAFAMTLPLLLSGWTGVPSLAKCGVAALAILLLSFGISKYVLKPFPHLVVIGLAGLSLLLAILNQDPGAESIR